MRKRVWALAAALLMLPLTGCGSLLNRDYSVTEPHSSSYYESEDRSVLRAESYQDLVNALLVLISGGAKEGTIWLYPDDSGLPAPQAAERACLEVQKETPLGAYAVEYLTYTVDETPRNYDAIQLTVGYRRTAAQVAGIVHITSTSALGDLLREAARNHAAELVVPDQAELRIQLAGIQSRLAAAMQRRLTAARQQLTFYAENRALQSPRNYLDDRRMALEYTHRQLTALAGALLEQKKREYVRLCAMLDSMSPLKVLGRGYAVVSKAPEGIVKSVHTVAPGDALTVRLTDGSLRATVETVWEETP